MATIGLKGNLLPDSEKDFADNYDAMKYKYCQMCGSGFTNKSVFTSLGWRETQISGWCEECFDALLKEPD